MVIKVYLWSLNNWTSSCCVRFWYGYRERGDGVVEYYRRPFPDGGNPASALWAFPGHLASHMSLDKIKGKMWDAWIPKPSDRVKTSFVKLFIMIGRMQRTSQWHGQKPHQTNLNMWLTKLKMMARYFLILSYFLIPNSYLLT